MNKVFSNIGDAIKDIKKGKMIILVDNPNRENEADFYIPADKITSKHIITMMRRGGGLICVAITQEQAHRLSIPLMVRAEENTEKTKVNFTVSVDAKHGVSTGTSAYDRLKTIKTLIDPSSRTDELTRPGHVFGLIAKAGGVLERNGHTEAAVDLARLAGFTPAGVVCEIVREDGRMAKLPDLQKLSQELNCKIISIEDLRRYMEKNPQLKERKRTSVIKVASSTLPTTYGTFQLSIYKSLDAQVEHAVLLLGDMKKQPLPVRVHSQCLTGDTFFSLKCDCREQLDQSMKKIQRAGRGIILYLNQEGRGIGLANKIKAYALQEKGYDTIAANEILGMPVDGRSYKIAADILKDIGISRINLLTNNPDKEKQLMSYGITIVKSLQLETPVHAVNKKYLATKKNRLGHRLTSV